MRLRGFKDGWRSLRVKKIVWNCQCTQTQITQARSSMTTTSPDGVREEAFTKSNVRGKKFF